MAVKKTKSKSSGPQYSMLQFAIIAFIVIILAVVMYFSFGKPAITGDVTLNQEEFNVVTPFGFTFSMLVVGVIAVTFTIFLITKEGAGK